MKIIYDSKLVLILAGAFAFAACDPIPKVKSADAPQYDSKAEAAYFNDAMDSVGDDEAADSTVDDSTREPISGPKLDGMADHKIAELDDDKSGTITEREFLDHDAKRKATEGTMTDDQKAKRQLHLKAEFEKFAGDDKVMSRDELKTFLDRQGPRVSGHRRRGREAEANRKAHPETQTHGGSSSGSSDSSGSHTGTETESHSESEHAGGHG